jgi:hypothetical protein
MDYAHPGATVEVGTPYLYIGLPGLRRWPLPLSRDTLMLLMAAINEIFLGIDIYLAHRISGTIVPNEWIPIIFGPSAGVVLLAAGLLARRNRPLATVLANIVFVLSIGVGLLGSWFHLIRAILPNAAAGSQVTIDLLVWAPPLLGPLTFALVGLLGISAAWQEVPPDSGRLRLLGNTHLSLPYSKTRAYLFLAGMGSLATVISAVLDHARSHFENPWLWLPTAVGVFGVVTAVGLAAFDHPRRGDVLTFVAAMGLMIAVGLLGAWLHIDQNLTTAGQVVVERFLRGAPFLAPLLFANMGALGLLALLPPDETE